ncbi:MAG: hypothetical protein WCG66_11015 [bacterium]
MKTPELCLILLLAVMPLHLWAGAKRTPPLTIRLHGEGSAADGPSFSSEIQLNNPHQKIFIRNVPVVSERDIVAFLPFPGSDGQVGAYFQLDAHGSNKIQQFTVEEKGRSAVVLFNGRIVANMTIHGAVNDGILFVPGGMTPSEVLLLEKQFPILGRESEFGKKTRHPRAAMTQP